MNKKETLKQQILQLSREYYNEVHRDSKVFEPGKSFVNYGGRFFDAEELVNLIDSSLDFWLTAGFCQRPCKCQTNPSTLR